MYKPQTK